MGGTQNSIQDTQAALPASLFKLNLGPVCECTQERENVLCMEVLEQRLYYPLLANQTAWVWVSPQPPAGTCSPAAQYSWIGKGNRLSKRVLHIRNSLLSGIPREEEEASWALALLSQLSHSLQNPVAQDVEQRISLE